MSGTTTAFCTSAKVELPQGAHCFNTSVVPTGDLTNGSTAIANLSSAAGLIHGMPVSGTGIPAATFILNNAGTWLLSKAATATNAGVVLTCAGDIFALALVKAAPTGTYGVATTNYSNLTGNSDEVTGTGYTVGGFVWTAAQNITPTSTGTTAFWSWNFNPSWAAATFTTTGGILYNQSYRANGNNRSVCVEDFGGSQSVTAGTLTVVLPTNNSTTAILRIT